MHDLFLNKMLQKL